jgi:hypothetical protein
MNVVDSVTMNEENKLRRQVKVMNYKEKQSSQMLIEMQKRFDEIEKRLGI